MPLVPLLASLICSSVHAAEVPQVDLDGDGKVDQIKVSEDTVRIGKHRIDCGGMASCEVQLHDISSTDALKEISLIQMGPRDQPEAYLYRLEDGQLTELSFPEDSSTDGDYQGPPDTFLTSGNGIVLTDRGQRIYTRREKYTVQGSELIRVPQPFWAVGFDMHVDRSFPIVRTIDDSDTVANVRQGSDVKILLESAEHPGWFLIHISSGLTGWANMETLMMGSDTIMGIMSAG